MVPFPPPPPPIAAVEVLKTAPHVDPAVKVAVVAVADKAVAIEENLAKWKIMIGNAVALLLVGLIGLAAAFVADLTLKLRTPVVIEAKK